MRPQENEYPGDNRTAPRRLKLTGAPISRGTFVWPVETNVSLTSPVSMQAQKFAWRRARPRIASRTKKKKGRGPCGRALS
jgi:hypothetical protein